MAVVAEERGFTGGKLKESGASRTKRTKVKGVRRREKLSSFN